MSDTRRDWLAGGDVRPYVARPRDGRNDVDGVLKLF